MRRPLPHVRPLILWSAALLPLASPLCGQAPTGLAVKTATNKQVVLTWSGAAASYSVQRAPLGGTFSTIATATTATYTDNSIDAYTTYQYQVLNGTAASGSVTEGPPPAGVTNAAPAPLVGATPSTTYGYNIALALDGNGDPAFAFLWDDPNNDGEHNDTQLLFRSWNRAKYAWNAVLKLATVADVANSSCSVTSLAYDTSTNAFAVASDSFTGPTGQRVIVLYVSTDGGATWSLKNSFNKNTGDSRGPSLALANGNLYLVHQTDYIGLTYVTGQLNQSPTTWSSKNPPTVPGIYMDSIFGESLALDSARNPAIAFWAANQTDGANGMLLYWKPAGAATPLKVMDSQDNGDGGPVKLVFFNLNPRVTVGVQRNDGDFAQIVHFAHSEDGGLTWLTPVLVPPDGNSTSDFPFDMALTSTGSVAVGFGQNGNYGDDSHKCGNPKLSLSTDLTHFTTCSFAGKDVTANFGVFPAGLQVAYGGNDKLYYLWLESSDTQANTGVLMYREPPAGAITGPSISGVSDGASFRPNIVAGSWVTITGANLSRTTRTWAGSDFNNGNNLPLALDGVSVKINGLSAAVYFISPGQVNVQAPSPINGSVSAQVTSAGVASNTITATASSNAPAFFAYAAGTKTYPAAVFPNGLIVGDPAVSGTAVSKAKPGDIILFYATGIGTSPAGGIIGAPIVYSNPLTVTIGGVNAIVQFAGLVASGEFQLNVVVPNLTPGEYPVVVSTAGQSSQPGVIVPIQ